MFRRNKDMACRFLEKWCSSFVGFLVEQRRRNHMAQTILSLLRAPLYHFSPQSPTVLSSYLTVLPKSPFSISVSVSPTLTLFLSLSPPFSVSLFLAICWSSYPSFYCYTAFSCREIWSVLSFCHSLLLSVHPSHTKKAWLHPSSIQHR